jgi:hypothetical protein
MEREKGEKRRGEEKRREGEKRRGDGVEVSFFMYLFVYLLI